MVIGVAPFGSWQYSQALRQKQAVFEAHTKSKKAVQWVLVTAEGLFNNEYARDLVDRQLTMADLFRS